MSMLCSKLCKGYVLTVQPVQDSMPTRKRQSIAAAPTGKRQSIAAAPTGKRQSIAAAPTGKRQSIAAPTRKRQRIAAAVSEIIAVSHKQCVVHLCRTCMESSNEEDIAPRSTRRKFRNDKSVSLHIRHHAMPLCCLAKEVKA